MCSLCQQYASLSQLCFCYFVIPPSSFPHSPILARLNIRPAPLTTTYLNLSHICPICHYARIAHYLQGVAHTLFTLCPNNLSLFHSTFYIIHHPLFQPTFSGRRFVLFQTPVNYLKLTHYYHMIRIPQPTPITAFILYTPLNISHLTRMKPVILVRSTFT